MNQDFASNDTPAPIQSDFISFYEQQRGTLDWLKVDR